MLVLAMFCVLYGQNIVLCVGGSKDKVCFIFHKVQGCCMEKKHSYKVNLFIVLLHSAFQKVIIAFLHTSTTLDSQL